MSTSKSLEGWWWWRKVSLPIEKPYGDWKLCKRIEVWMSKGHLYILFNRALLADEYKIGKTTTKTPEALARKLSDAASIPITFEVLYEQRVVDCHRGERLLFQKLLKFRSSKRPGFFRVPLKTAIAMLEEVASEVGKIKVR